MIQALTLTEAPLATVDQGGFAISAAEYTQFVELPIQQREIILLTLEAFDHIGSATKCAKVKTCRKLASEMAKTYGKMRGFSAQALYNKYTLYTKGGRKRDAKGNPTGPIYQPRDWRCLVPAYNNGTQGLPPAFVKYLVGEWSKTTRKNDAWASLVARLRKDWMDGREIPGYGTADEWYPRQGRIRPMEKFIRDKDLPRGWSEINLWRALQKALPRKSQRRAAQGQVGRLNNDWGAKLLRDRSQLMPLQLWTIDDVRLDLQARMYVDGKWQIVYVDALFALDVATGFILAYGLKGKATRGEDTEAGRSAGTKMSIDGRDVRHLVLSVLSQVGLPPWKSKLLCEMATGKLNAEDERALLAMLQNHFEIDYTGMGFGQLLKSGFAEEWGRPGMKGWIEAYFRKLHTMLNAVPGTTGRRYDMGRGDHAARIKYTTQLIQRAEKAIQGPLTPDHPLSEQLIFPVMTVDEINGIVGEMVDALNWRTDHRLQGFERVFEFQAQSGHWLPEAALHTLPPAERAGIELTPRMEAPAERLRRLLGPHAGKFRKVAPEALAALYAEKRHVTVRSGRISVTDQRLGTDRMTFVAQDTHALDAWENAGEKAVMAYLPEDYSHAVLSDAQTGAYIATLQREGRVNILDDEAIGRRAGQVRREWESELDHLRTYLGEQEDQLSTMRDTNDRLIAESIPAPETAQAVATARREQAHRVQRRRANKATASDLQTLFQDDAQDDYEAPSLDDILP